MVTQILFREDHDRIGVIQGHGISDIHVWTAITERGKSYHYRIGPYTSDRSYAVPQMAWFDGMRPQRIMKSYRLVPDNGAESDSERVCREMWRAGCLLF